MRGTQKVQEVYSPIKRLQKGSPPGLLLILVLYMVYPYLDPEYTKQVLATPISNDDLVLTLIATNPVSVAYTSFAMTSSPVSPTATPTPSPFPSPTSTPGRGIVVYDNSTPVASADLMLFKLSFYDPAIGVYFPNDPSIGHTNCAEWDEVNLVCNSTMADGTPFHYWYGKHAVACPPPLRFGDVIRVVYPVQLQGDWTCVDRGGAIVDGYLDFLLKYPDEVWTGYNLSLFPWSSTVQAYLLTPR